MVDTASVNGTTEAPPERVLPEFVEITQLRCNASHRRAPNER